MLQGAFIPPCGSAEASVKILRLLMREKFPTDPFLIAKSTHNHTDTMLA